MPIAYKDHGNYATDIRFVEEGYVPAAGEKIKEGDTLPTLADLGYAPMPPSLKEQAAALLPETDMVAWRCYKAGIPYPALWQTYTTELRLIANGQDTTSTLLPNKPDYPNGT